MKRRVDSVLLCITVLLGAVLGLRPLDDPDLGWHLAGGLWMLENRTVPYIDPFGAQKALWRCYSWLPELLYALVLRRWGWEGLQILQCALTAAGAVVIFFVLRRAARSGAGFFEPGPRDGKPEQDEDWVYGMRLCAALFIMILFTVPIWYLRPQFISLVCWALACLILEAFGGRMSLLLPLALFWVNVHVFWIFLPPAAFLSRLLSKGRASKENLDGAVRAAVLLSLCSLVNPYGWSIYEEIAAFITAHEAVYAGVVECAHLSADAGYLLVLFAAVVLWLLWCSRTLIKKEPVLFLLTCFFAAAGAARIRLLPFCGLTAAILFAKSGPATVPRWLAAEGGAGRSRRAAAVLLAVLFLLLAVDEAVLPPPLTEKKTALLAAAARLSEQAPGSGEVVVFNHFDEGGWLALGFWLAKGDAADSRFKTALDGRTGMTGDERFAQFDRIIRLRPGWCRLLESWNPQAAVLSKELRITAALTGRGGEGCGTWKLLLSEGPYDVLLKQESS